MLYLEKSKRFFVLFKLFPLINMSISFDNFFQWIPKNVRDHSLCNLKSTDTVT